MINKPGVQGFRLEFRESQTDVFEGMRVGEIVKGMVLDKLKVEVHRQSPG